MAGSLEATERRRLQLVGDVAHELRTPLTTLDGYLEGLEDGVIAPSAQTWRLLRAETARLTRMVNDLSGAVASGGAPAAAADRRRRCRRGRPRGGRAVRAAGRRPRASHSSCRRAARSRMADRDRRGAGPRELPLQRAPPRAGRVADHGRRGARPGRCPRVASRTRDRAWRPTSSRRCSSGSTGWTRHAAARRVDPGSGWRSCARLRRRWAAGVGRERRSGPRRHLPRGAAGRVTAGQVPTGRRSARSCPGSRRPTPCGSSRRSRCRRGARPGS